MKTLYDSDNSFFFIESDDLDGDDKSVTKLTERDLISFSLTEEIGKIISGNLSIHDPSNIYSKMLRNGMKFALTFGYKKFSKSQKDLNLFSDDPDESIGAGERRGITGIISSPSGSGSSTGQTIYNVSFYGSEILGENEKKTFASGTRKSVIEDLFSSLGISDTVVDFNTQNDSVTTDSPIRQWENPFLTILNKSIEWRTIFRTGYKQNGQPVGIFIDPGKLDDKKVQNAIEGITGVKGKKRTLYWNEGKKSNVTSFDWKHNIGESGQGSGVQIRIIDGQPVVQRFNAETLKTETYQLDIGKVRKRLGEEKTASNRLALTKQVLSSKSFEDVKWAFTAVEQRTAPDGMGFEVKAEMNGDPLITPAMQVAFGTTFPAPLRQGETKNPLGALTKFYIKRVSHNFTKQGYRTSIDVSDGYTITGSTVEPDRRIL